MKTPCRAFEQLFDSSKHSTAHPSLMETCRLCIPGSVFLSPKETLPHFLRLGVWLGSLRGFWACSSHSPLVFVWCVPLLTSQYTAVRSPLKATSLNLWFLKCGLLSTLAAAKIWYDWLFAFACSWKIGVALSRSKGGNIWIPDPLNSQQLLGKYLRLKHGVSQVGRITYFRSKIISGFVASR